MTFVITTDLDRTLIFSRRAISELGGDLPADVIDHTTTTTIEFAQEAARSLAALPPDAVLIPVTTRSREQLGKFELMTRTRYAVVANGAVVLVDGQPDPHWHPEPAAGTGSISAAQAILAGADTAHLILRQRTVGDAFIYAIADSPADAAAITNNCLRCSDINWAAIQSGRKVYLVPAHIDKALAISYLCERIATEQKQPVIRLAAGDSALDRGMLAGADEAWVPLGSDLDRELPATERANYRFTSSPGHQAAAEITAAWLDVVSGRRQLT